MSPWPDDDVILYDGVCVFCSRTLAFGIDPDDPDTNAVIHDGVAYFKSDAALTVLGTLPGSGWVRGLRTVPKPLRDAIYSRISCNRYRIFGEYQECFVPDAELKTRVME